MDNLLSFKLMTEGSVLIIMKKRVILIKRKVKSIAKEKGVAEKNELKVKEKSKQ